MKTTLVSLLLVVCLLIFAAASLAPTTISAALDVQISEVRTDQPGSDTDEYFELAGAADTDLSALTYLVIGDGTGGSGVIEAVIPLTGQRIPASGYFVVAESTFTLGTADLTATLNFENDDNTTHLLVESFSGSLGDDLDTDDDGVLDTTPWAGEVSKIAIIREENPPSGTEYHYGPPTVGPDGSSAPGHVYRCATGAAWQIGPFDIAGGKDTPGAANRCAVAGDFGTCGDAATFIHEVQGDGAFSPQVGEIVVVEAVVHGDFQGAGALGGFFLQEEDGDADANPQTSEGLYVDDAGVGLDVQIGDLVRVQGEVEERYGKTQLTAVSNIAACSGGNAVTPVAVTLPVAGLDRWEALEGMAVTISQTLHVTENYTQGRYGEVGLSTDGRLFNPTNVTLPGDTANALQAANDLARILLDDGRRSQNPNPPPYFATDGTLRAGDTLTGLSGALDYNFGAYRIQPTEDISFSRVNDRPPAPDAVGGRLSVASFNVLNYFTTLDDGSDSCGPSGDMECRGADTLEEFQRQRAKIIAALEQIDADVVGLIEIENNATAAIDDLVAGLNDAMGPGTYRYIDTGTIGSDAIKVALLYKPVAVQPVGAYAVLDAAVDPDFNDRLNRPALAQSFQEVATGEVFTAAVNHLKSKGSSCAGVGDPDIGDGQGNCNGTRTAAAITLAEWLATDPTGSGDPDRLIIGDLNAYAKEDPIAALSGRGYVDLIDRYLAPAARYSYVFAGQAGYLDHGLANAALVGQVSGVTVWHINSDEPSALDYNNYNQPALYQPGPYRSSDHDPVIVGLKLGGTVEMMRLYLPVVVGP
ncbi:MAG: ExeM/NucH family extracellular endonuclease [Chloroflexota bacterium]